jgi:hypothetical protein
MDRKAYYLKNKEKYAAKRKAAYEANKEQEALYAKAYHEKGGIGVYAWKDKNDGTVIYVGSGYFEQRKKMQIALHTTTTNKKLQALFKENGIDRYEFVKIEEFDGDIKERKTKEQYWINKLKPICNKFKATRTPEEAKIYRNKKWMELYYKKKNEQKEGLQRIPS